MTTRQDVLRHYGVKGMQWGVRNDNRTRGQKRADKKWAQNIYTIRGAAAVHNIVADRMNNGENAAINARHPRADLNRPNMPETQAYIRDYNQTITRLASEGVTRVHGVSPSGRLQARVDASDPTQLRVIVEERDINHADEPLPTLYFYLKLDARGQRIEGVYDAPDVEELEQADMDDDILEHYGTKGMKWGVRKKSSSGLSRTRAGALARNERLVKQGERLRDRQAGRVMNALSAPDKMIMGERMFAQFHNQRIERIQAQSDRIRSGEMSLLDRFDVTLNTPLRDIFFEQRESN